MNGSKNEQNQEVFTKSIPQKIVKATSNIIIIAAGKIQPNRNVLNNLSFSDNSFFILQIYTKYIRLLKYLLFAHRNKDFVESSWLTYGSKMDNILYEYPCYVK